MSAIAAYPLSLSVDASDDAVWQCEEEEGAADE